MDNNKKVALITGLTCQDGIYLTKFLLNKGNYEIHGTARRSSVHLGVIEAMKQNNNNIFIHIGELTDYSFVMWLIKTVKPDEVYNFAAQASVPLSMTHPLLTADVTALSCIRLLEAIKENGLTKKTKFMQASTSEMFGAAEGNIVNETSPLLIQSPYAAAKMYAHYTTIMYREIYGMFTCCSVSFNHESPFRGSDSVTRKITLAAAKISLGLQDCVYLGNMDASRDWGFAGDFIEAYWMMLNATNKAAEYVIGTGQSHTVREFATFSFKAVGIEIEWNGKGVDEVGTNIKTGQAVVKIEPKFFRPGVEACRVADCRKIKEELGWEPNTSFEEFVRQMVESDKVAAAKQDSSKAL